MNSSNVLQNLCGHQIPLSIPRKTVERQKPEPIVTAKRRAILNIHVIRATGTTAVAGNKIIPLG